MGRRSVFCMVCTYRQLGQVLRLRNLPAIIMTTTETEHKDETDNATRYGITPLTAKMSEGTSRNNSYNYSTSISHLLTDFTKYLTDTL